MRKVGILYDNISGNTGDVAIGLSLKKILSEIGIQFDELSPGKFDSDSYDTIIIGGGHLIRPSPDFFYDRFKVPGNHILNAVGIVDAPQDLHYLNKYKFISVRSSWDRERLCYIDKDVHVIPCTTMLLDDVENIPIFPKKPSLGIHLLPNTLSKSEEREFAEWVSSLPFTVYFLPITFYNKDYIYLKKLSSKIKNSVMLPLMEPREIFTYKGKLDYFISSSLHGGIFSYRHNIPFIMFNYNEKMFYFMKDRGLEQYTFTNFTEMKAAFNRLLRDQPDYSEKVSLDLDILGKYVELLKELLQPDTLNENFIAKSHNQNIHKVQNPYAKNSESQVEIIAKLQEVSNQVRATTERDSNRISALTAQLDEAAEHALALGQKNNEMQEMMVWQTTMRCRNRFVERVCPIGSFRRKIYNHFCLIIGVSYQKLLKNL
jgi:hypothetical protein